MKILIALMMFFSLAASAEDKPIIENHEIPIECFPIDPFLKNFSEHYKEELVFISESFNHLNEPLFHQLWVNPTTKTWTFFVSNKPRQTICVIASGQGYNNWGPSI